MDLKTRVELAIKEALEQCDIDRMPHIYKLRQTEEGYRKLESLIFNMMIKNNFTPSECLPHIESEEL